MLTFDPGPVSKKPFLYQSPLFIGDGMKKFTAFLNE